MQELVGKIKNNKGLNESPKRDRFDLKIKLLQYQNYSPVYHYSNKSNLVTSILVTFSHEK